MKYEEIHTLYATLSNNYDNIAKKHRIKRK